MRKYYREARNQPLIVGAGTVVLDVILNNGSSRPVFMAGGTCGNVMAGLSFLGWASTAISRAGQDVARKIMVEDLARNGVNTGCITSEEILRTPRIVEKLDSDGSFARHSFALRCPACNNYLPRFRSPVAHFAEKVYERFPEVDVYFFDRVTPFTLKLATLYRDSGALVFFEPGKLKNMGEVARGAEICHVLKYAGTEFEVSDVAASKESVVELMNSHKIYLVIQTSGKNGLSFRPFNDLGWHDRPSYTPKMLQDTCGAGDWLTVGFLYQMEKMARGNKIGLVEALGYSGLIDSALNFAQALSSLSCMFVGARGLSRFMDQKSALKAIESWLVNGVAPNLRGSDGHSGETMDGTVPSSTESSHGLCPICLLGTRS